MKNHAKTETKTSQSKFDLGKIGKEALKPILVIAGMVGGKFVGDYADKAMGVTRKDGIATLTAGGDAGMKGYITPVGQLALGAVGATMLKDENLKFLSAGVAAQGVLGTVNMIAKKNVLNGLGAAEQTYLLPDYPMPGQQMLPTFNDAGAQQISGAPNM